MKRLLTLCRTLSKRNGQLPTYFSSALLTRPTSLMSGEGRRSIKIYTRTGDDGTSALFTGERRHKDNKVFEALGSTDELNSAIGLAREFCKESNPAMVERLEQITRTSIITRMSSNFSQIRPRIAELADWIFFIHAETIAASDLKVCRCRQLIEFMKLLKTEFSTDCVPELESWIDEYTAQLPPLTMFIIPSGGKAASSLHMARSICRRAERRVIPLVRDCEMDDEPLRFLNRLSDFLFTAARFAAHTEGEKEVIYRRKDSKTKT